LFHKAHKSGGNEVGNETRMAMQTKSKKPVLFGRNILRWKERL